jgi:zinc transport system substrate-binding protein
MAVIALALASCGQPQSATSRRLHVVATVFPLAWIAQQVAPDLELEFLGGQNQERHGLELSPADREALQAADVVLYMGDIGFQPQIEEAVRSSRGRVVSVIATIGDRALPIRAAHAHGSDPGGALDPHVWFDAGLMAMVTERIGEVFAATDPGRATTYQANAADIARQLDALDAEIARMLEACRFDEAIVSHEAYAYLLRPHGLTQQGISGAEPEAGASPARLAELTVQIKAHGISAILAEPVEGRADAEALAREAGVDVLAINPLEAVTDREHKTGYVTLLRQQAETFATALQCAGRGSGVGNPAARGSGVGNPGEKGRG